MTGAKVDGGQADFGHALNVVVLDANLQTRNRYLAIAVTRALARHPRVARASLVEYDDVVGACRQDAVDLLLVMGGSDGFAAVILRAAAFARASVLWTGEDPYELPANIALARHFDLTFTNDAGAVRAYASGGIDPARVAYLPLAASLDFHDPQPEPEQDSLYDLLFVGTAWPNRIQTIDALVARLPVGLKLKFGLSGNPFLTGRDLARPDLLTNFRLSPRDFARMAARSRLVLTLDRAFSAARNGAALGASPPPRLFEIGLSGTAQVYLSAGRADPAAYRDGTEIAIARSVRQAAAAIARLLADDETRRRMGAAARRRTLAEHLYQHRVEAILAQLDAHVAKSTGPGLRWPVGPASGKARLLLVAHNLSGVPPVGGVELYQDTLVAALPDYEFVFLASSSRRVALTLIDPARRAIEAYPVQFLDEGVAFEAQRERIFHDVLLRHEIDLVHVQHLLHHSWAYPMIARMLGVPQIATAHDYFLACTRFNLIGPEGVFCGIDTDRTAPCDACLWRTQALEAGAQARRREIMRVSLGCLDRLLFNTPASRDIMRRIYPGLPEDFCTVVGMTGDPETLEAVSAARPRKGSMRDDTGRLRVVLLGNVSAPKGGDLLLRVARALRHDPIVFHLHGRVDDTYVDALAAMSNVVMHGPYKGRDLAGRLGGGVSLHLSVWPETYCITLDEGRAAGLVPVVLGYGALAERVRDGVDGYVVDPARPDDVVPLLRGLAADSAGLEKLAVDYGWSAQAGFKAHIAAIREIYAATLAGRPVPHGSVPAQHRRVPSFADLRWRFNAERWDSPDLAIDAAPPGGPTRRPVEAAPPRPGWLKRLLTPARPGAQGHLDTFAGPHDGDERVIARSQLAELRIGGWLVPRDRSNCYSEIELRLAGAWSVRIATIVTPRADVAAKLEAPHLARCGFVSLAELGSVPAGAYAAELHGRRKDGIVDVLPVGRITIA